MPLVHLLPSSDNVIALGQDGQIVEQGSFAKLQSSGKYVQSLDITNHHTDDNESSEAASKQDIIEEIKDVTPENEEQEQEIEEEEAVSSDRSTFHYYFKSMRPLSLIIAASYIVTATFSSTFRCKLWQRGEWTEYGGSELTILRFSCLAHLVG